MNLRVALAGLVAVIISIYAVVGVLTLRHPASSAAKAEGTAPAASPVMAPTVGEDPPAISPTGPYPKAVIDETEVQFGRMEVGEERSHEFVIRNEGEAPLIIRKGKTTCQCTLSSLDKGEVPVGGSVTATVKWKPTAQAENFSKGASLLTNDPEHKVISLEIKGMVAPRLITVPVKDWFVANVADDGPTAFSGKVISPMVEKFNVVGIESGSPYLTAEAVPLDQGQLGSERALCGFEIHVTLSPEVPVGPFAIPLKIKTDVPQREADGKLGEPTEVDVLVSGTRRGPVRILGQAWSEERMAISLGSIDSTKGKTVTVMMAIRGAPEEGLKFIGEPVCDPPELKASIVPDEKSFGKYPRYLLKLEYPVGAPRTVRLEGAPASIKFHTNHPRAEEVDLQVYFSAF